MDTDNDKMISKEEFDGFLAKQKEEMRKGGKEALEKLEFPSNRTMVGQFMYKYVEVQINDMEEGEEIIEEGEEIELGDIDNMDPETLKQYMEMEGG